MTGMRSSAAALSERRAGAAVVGGFVLLSLCFTGQFPPFSNPNESSRFATVYAFVERGTFQVDAALPIVGDSEDKSASGGHFYSNKAPGLAFAAIPVYRALRTVFPAPHSPFEPIWFWVRFLVVTVPCAFALVRLQAMLIARRTPGASLVVAAVALGTPFLFYGRTFFSHAWTAALLFLAWDLLRAGEAASVRRRVGFLLWSAGAVAGWAAISEYPVAVLAGLLLVRAAARRSWTHALYFAGGLALPLMLLMVYDTICFGSPFVLSSAREAYPQYSSLAGHGVFGFGFPDFRIALAYLFHPARGLLLFSPFLAWCVPGFIRWVKSRDDRADMAWCLSASLLFFVAMCAYPNWHGGWSLGDRYLLPILFPLAVGASHALSSPRSRWLFAAATVFSVALHGLACLTWPNFPDNVIWPPAAGSWWFLTRGWVAPAVLAPVFTVAAAIAVTALVTGAVLAAEPGSRWRSGLAAAVGLAAFLVTIIAAPAPAFEVRLWRAAALSRYSGVDPAASELNAVVRSAASPAERRRAAGIWRRYGPEP